MKLREAISIYNFLGEVKVTKMEVSEVLKVVKARKEIKPHFDGWQSFVEDLQNKLKPEELDGNDEEAVKAFNKKLNEAAMPELEREIEVKIEPLSDEAVAAILSENNINARELMTLLEPIL